MAQIVIQRGAAHEIWVEPDPENFTGVSPPVVVTTAIKAVPADLDHTRVRLYIRDVVGAPVIGLPTVVLVPSFTWQVIQVAFQNTSGNIADKATWKLEVERIWSAAR